MARVLEYHTGGLFTYGSLAVQTDWDYPWLAQELTQEEKDVALCVIRSRGEA